MATCPLYNDEKVRNDFNSIVERFGGTPLSYEEFTLRGKRNARTDIDALAMNTAYLLWDKHEGDMNKIKNDIIYKLSNFLPKFILSFNNKADAISTFYSKYAKTLKLGRVEIAEIMSYINNIYNSKSIINKLNIPEMNAVRTNEIVEYLTHQIIRYINSNSGVSSNDAFNAVLNEYLKELRNAYIGIIRKIGGDLTGNLRKIMSEQLLETGIINIEGAFNTDLANNILEEEGLIQFKDFLIKISDNNISSVQGILKDLEFNTLAEVLYSQTGKKTSLKEFKKDTAEKILSISSTVLTDYFNSKVDEALDAFKKTVEAPIDAEVNPELFKKLSTIFNHYVRPVYENFETISKLVKLSVNKYESAVGISSIDSEFSEDDYDMLEELTSLDEDGGIEEESNEKLDYDSSHFEREIKLSSKVRRLFFGLDSGAKTFFGKPKYVNPITAQSIVKSLLSDSQGGLEDMISILRTNSGRYPWLEELADRVTKAPKSIQNAFKTNLSMTYMNYYTVMYEDENSVMFRINDSSTIANITKLWFSKFSVSDFVSDGVNVNVDKLLNEYKSTLDTVVKLVREKKIEEASNLVVEFIGRLGFDLSEESIVQIKNNNLKLGNKTLNIVDVLRSKYSPVKLIIDKVNELVNKNQSLTVIDFSSLFNEGAFKKFARFELKNNIELIPVSHRAGKKKIYSYIWPNYLTILTNRIKKNYNGITSKLISVPYYSNNPWLKKALDETASDEDKISIGAVSIEAVRKFSSKSSNKKKLGQIDDGEHELYTATAFIKTIVGDEGKVPYNFILTSDKSSYYTVVADLFDISLNEDGSVSDDTIDYLYTLSAEPEIKRMQAVKKAIENGEEVPANLKTGAFIFYLNPKLNTIKELFDEDGYIVDEITPELKGKITGLLRESVESEVETRLKNYTKWGILKFFDKRTLKDLSETYKLKKDAVEKAIASIVTIQSRLGYSSIYTSLVPDPASIYKAKHSKNVIKLFKTNNKDLEGLTDLQVLRLLPEEELAKVLNIFKEDFNKRAAMFIASGRVNSGPNDTVNYLVAEDKATDSLMLEQLKEIIGKDAEAYSKNGLLSEGTNGQEFVTFKEYTKILFEDGNISDELYEAINVFLDNNNEEDYYNSLVEFLTDKGLIDEFNKLEFSAMKPVYNWFQMDDLIGYNPVYIKTSAYPLMPNLKSTELNKIRKVMEKNNIDRLAFPSGVKIGAPNKVLKLWDDNGIVREDITPEEVTQSVKKLDRIGLRIQQDVPSHGLKNIVNRASQADKNLFTDLLGVNNFVYKGESYTGKQLALKYNELYKRLYEIKRKQLLEEIDAKVDEKNGTIISINKDKFLNILREEAIIKNTGTSYSSVEIEALGLEYALDALALLPSSKKFEALINALIKNRVLKIKFPGNSYVLSTEEGYQFTDEGSQFTEIPEESNKNSEVSNELLKQVEELFDSNPDLANEVYEALGFNDKEITIGEGSIDHDNYEGDVVDKGDYFEVVNPYTPQQKQQAIKLYSEYLQQYPNGNVDMFKIWLKNKNNLDLELLQKIVETLQELYPEIQLIINEDPVWEQPSNDILNQIFRFEIGESGNIEFLVYDMEENDITKLKRYINTLNKKSSIIGNALIEHKSTAKAIKHRVVKDINPINYAIRQLSNLIYLEEYEEIFSKHFNTINEFISYVDDIIGKYVNMDIDHVTNIIKSHKEFIDLQADNKYKLYKVYTDTYNTLLETIKFQIYQFLKIKGKKTLSEKDLEDYKKVLHDLEKQYINIYESIKYNKVFKNNVFTWKKIIDSFRNEIHNDITFIDNYKYKPNSFPKHMLFFHYKKFLNSLDINLKDFKVGKPKYFYIYKQYDNLIKLRQIIELNNKNKLSDIGLNSIDEYKELLLNTIKSYLFTYVSYMPDLHYYNGLQHFFNDDKLLQEYIKSSRNYHSIIYNRERYVEELIDIEKENKNLNKSEKGESLQIPTNKKDEFYNKSIKKLVNEGRVIVNNNTITEENIPDLEELDDEIIVILDKNNNKSELFETLLRFKENFKSAIIDYAKIESTNFKNWFGLDANNNDFTFGNSNVVLRNKHTSIYKTKSNEPYIFFHGTSSENYFNNFSYDFLLSGEGVNAYGAGFYFTDYLPTAENYAGIKKFKGTIYKLQLNKLKNNSVAIEAALAKLYRSLGFNHVEVNDLLKHTLKDIVRLKNESPDNIIKYLKNDYNNIYHERLSALLKEYDSNNNKVYAVYLNVSNPLKWDKKIRPYILRYIYKNVPEDLKSYIEDRIDLNSNEGTLYNLIVSYFVNKGQTHSNAQLSTSQLLYSIGIDGVEHFTGGGRALGGFRHKRGERHVIAFHPSQIKSVSNSGLFRVDSDDMFDYYKSDINYTRTSTNLHYQRLHSKILGQANIKALKILIDAANMKMDTLPHEYAHFYIAWYRNTPIVQEAIKKWGSEEALVQAIGEQAVKQKGEAWDWWTRFVKWILNQFNRLSDLTKEELRNILTDAFLTRQDLNNIGVKTQGFKFEKQNVFTVNPINKVDEKAKAKASISNKFIGFAENIPGSSTAEYAKQIINQTSTNQANQSVQTNQPISTKDNPIHIYTDGSDIKGTGKIGTGVYIEYDGKEVRKSNIHDVDSFKSKYNIKTGVSNPTMEIAALVEALEEFKDRGEHLVIHSDYQGVQKWISGEWKVKQPYIEDFVNQAKDLIAQIEKNGGSVQLKWVRGHSGVKGNEMVDAVAKDRNVYNNISELFQTSQVESTINEVKNNIVNSENYSSSDVVFVSIPGKRGDLNTRRKQQNKTIDEALKAIEAGAVLITDNKEYVEKSDYNEGEKRLAEVLRSKGYQYSETTVDGHVLGVWTKSSSEFTGKTPFSDKSLSKESQAFESTSLGIKEDIIYTTNFKGTLNPGEFVDENGNTLSGETLKEALESGKAIVKKPAQVIVPWKFAINGKKINIRDYIVNGRVDLSKIDKEALEIFGMRIPNAGLNSHAYIEIVGFLPEGYGDLVIAPRDFLAQMGSDFDVDKLFTYASKVYIKDGVIKALDLDTLDEYKEELSKAISSIKHKKNNNVQSDIAQYYNSVKELERELDRAEEEAIKGEIKKIHNIILKTPDPIVMYKNLTPTSFWKFDELAKEAKEEFNSILPELTSDAYQRTQRKIANSGKELVGVFALYNSFVSMFQISNISLNLEGFILENDTLQLILNINGKRSFGDVYSPLTMECEDLYTKRLAQHLNIDFKEARKKAKSDMSYLFKLLSPDEITFRSEVLNGLLQSAVDNQKEQILGPLGININNASLAATMAMLGYGEEVAYLFRVPAVKKVYDLVEYYQSGLVGEYYSNSEILLVSIEEVLKEITNGEESNILELIGKYGTVYKKAYNIEGLTTAEMKKAIESDIDSELETNLKALGTLYILSGLSSQASTIINGLKIDSKFIAPSYSEALMQKQRLHTVLKLSEANKTIYNIFDTNTVQSSATTTGLGLFSELYRTFYAKSSEGFMAFLDSVSRYLKVETVDAFDNIWNFYTNYLYVSAITSRYEGKSISEVRETLLSKDSNNSISKHLLSLKNDDRYKNNLFIKSLEVVDISKAYEGVKIGSSLIHMEEDIIKDMLDLYYSGTPTNISDNYTSTTFIEDLVAASILQGNVLDFTSPLKVISTVVLEDMGIIQNIINTIKNPNGFYLYSSLYIQFIQYNPKYATPYKFEDLIEEKDSDGNTSYFINVVDDLDYKIALSKNIPYYVIKIKEGDKFFRIYLVEVTEESLKDGKVKLVELPIIKNKDYLMLDPANLTLDASKLHSVKKSPYGYLNSNTSKYISNTVITNNTSNLNNNDITQNTIKDYSTEEIINKLLVSNDVDPYTKHLLELFRNYSPVNNTRVTFYNNYVIRGRYTGDKILIGLSDVHGNKYSAKEIAQAFAHELVHSIYHTAVNNTPNNTKIKETLSSLDNIHSIYTTYIKTTYNNEYNKFHQLYTRYKESTNIDERDYLMDEIKKLGDSNFLQALYATTNINEFMSVILSNPDVVRDYLNKVPAKDVESKKTLLDSIAELFRKLMDLLGFNTTRLTEQAITESLTLYKLTSNLKNPAGNRNIKNNLPNFVDRPSPTDILRQFGELNPDGTPKLLAVDKNGSSERYKIMQKRAIRINKGQSYYRAYVAKTTGESVGRPNQLFYFINLIPITNPDVNSVSAREANDRKNFCR